MEEKDTKKTNKKPIIIGAVAAVVVVAVVCVLLFSNKAIRATTMRMLRMEGTVILEENGKLKEVREDLRLKSGNAVSTEDESLCSIGLDETKIVTLDENSRAEFTKKGKALNLNLTQGSLFFEVSKKLASDESFEIETTTMIVGIRGTSGLVTCDTEGHEGVICTDGTIHLTAKHPRTGEIKEIDVPAGSKVTVYIYDREVDGVMFEVVPLTEEDIPDFVTDRLVENMVLLDKVVSDTGWSKPLILGEDVTVESNDEKEDETPEVETEETEELGEETDPETLEPEEELPPETPTQPQNTLPDGVVKNADGTYTLSDGTVFDPDFYRQQYSDLAGMSDEELLNHYLNHGKGEKRSANQTEQDKKDKEEADKLAQQNAGGDDDSSGGSSGGSSDPSNSDPGSGNNSGSSGSYSVVDGTDSQGNPVQMVQDGSGNTIGQYNDGFLVVTNNVTLPTQIVQPGNTDPTEYSLSKMWFTEETPSGTMITFQNGTTVTKTGDAAAGTQYVINYTENGEAKTRTVYNNNPIYGESELYNGNTSMGYAGMMFDAERVYVTDDGQVLIIQ